MTKMLQATWPEQSLRGEGLMILKRESEPSGGNTLSHGNLQSMPICIYYLHIFEVS